MDPQFCEPFWEGLLVSRKLLLTIPGANRLKILQTDTLLHQIGSKPLFFRALKSF